MPSDGVAHPEIKLLAIIGDAGADAASAEGIPSDQPGSRASIGKVEPQDQRSGGIPLIVSAPAAQAARRG